MSHGRPVNHTSQANCQRPYHVGHTSSHSNTEVKQHGPMSVLGWVTVQGKQVLLASPLGGLNPSVLITIRSNTLVGNFCKDALRFSGKPCNPATGRCNLRSPTHNIHQQLQHHLQLKLRYHIFT